MNQSTGCTGDLLLYNNNQSNYYSHSIPATTKLCTTSYIDHRNNSIDPVYTIDHTGTVHCINVRCNTIDQLNELHLNIIDINTTQKYIVALTKHGELYIYNTNKPSTQWISLQCNSRVQSITSGLSHTLVLCINGDVYTYGDNMLYQCIGMNTYKYQPKTKTQLNVVEQYLLTGTVNTDNHENVSLNNHPNPMSNQYKQLQPICSKLTYHQYFYNNKISYVSATQNLSVAVDSCNNTYVWGQSLLHTYQVPQQLITSTTQQWVGVACDLYSVYLVNNKGELYTYKFSAKDHIIHYIPFKQSIQSIYMKHSSLYCISTDKHEVYVSDQHNDVFTLLPNLNSVSHICLSGSTTYMYIHTNIQQITPNIICIDGGTTLTLYGTGYNSAQYSTNNMNVRIDYNNHVYNVPAQYHHQLNCIQCTAPEFILSNNTDDSAAHISLTLDNIHYSNILDIDIYYVPDLMNDTTLSGTSGLVSGQHRLILSAVLQPLPYNNVYIKLMNQHTEWIVNGQYDMNTSTIQFITPDIQSSVTDADHLILCDLYVSLDNQSTWLPTCVQYTYIHIQSYDIQPNQLTLYTAHDIIIQISSIPDPTTVTLLLQSDGNYSNSTVQVQGRYIDWKQRIVYEQNRLDAMKHRSIELQQLWSSSACTPHYVLNTSQHTLYDINEYNQLTQLIQQQQQLVDNILPGTYYIEFTTPQYTAASIISISLSLNRIHYLQLQHRLEIAPIQ